jgi:hypothetical protein
MIKKSYWDDHANAVENSAAIWYSLADEIRRQLIFISNDAVRKSTEKLANAYSACGESLEYCAIIAREHRDILDQETEKQWKGKE